MPFAKSRMPAVPRAAYSCRYPHCRTKSPGRNSRPRSFTEDCSNFYRFILCTFTHVYLCTTTATVMLLNCRKRCRLWNVGRSVCIQNVQGDQNQKKCTRSHLTLIQQKFRAAREKSSRAECSAAITRSTPTLCDDITDDKCQCYINWGALIH